jgi:hypothetical protein
MSSGIESLYNRVLDCDKSPIIVRDLIHRLIRQFLQCDKLGAENATDFLVFGSGDANFGA